MPAQFFAKIDSWWKVLSILGAVITAGVAVGMTIAGFMSMPSIVKAHGDRIAALEMKTSAADADAVRSRESIEMRLERVECLVIAGRRDTPIEDCL